MSNIKLVLIPPFMAAGVKSGAIEKSKLLDLGALRSILSDLSVAKYFYLNSNTFLNKKQSAPIADLLLLNKLKEYVDNPLPSPPDDIKLAGCGYGSVLDCLCSVGDEPLNKALVTQLTNYALRFDVVHISNKTYGIMFKPLCEVESPCERFGMFRQDLDELLKQVTLVMPDSELLQEDLYQEYLSLM